MSEGGKVITVRMLAKAIARGTGHEMAQASEEARAVLNHFGFRDTIIDNAVEPEDRKLFYTLHEAGLLQTSWETVPLIDGRHWRIFYWRLDASVIERLAKPPKGPSENQIYRELPEEAWAHPPTSA